MTPNSNNSNAKKVQQGYYRVTKKFVLKWIIPQYLVHKLGLCLYVCVCRQLQILMNENPYCFKMPHSNNNLSAKKMQQGYYRVTTAIILKKISCKAADY